VKSEEFSNSSEFIDIDKVEFIDNFPKLSYDYILNIITLGTYPLKQCYSYLAEHFNKESKLKLKISRKTSLTVYVSYPIEKCENEGELINGWYCTCKNGTRTVGCCSHIAAIIYYLGCGRYLEKVENPAGFLTEFFKKSYFDESTDDDLELKSQKPLLNKKTKGKKYNVIFSTEEEYSENEIIINELESSIKRSLSFAEKPDEKKKQKINSEMNLNLNIIFEDFLNHVLN
ncbi:unnamed protein product, partial [Brachionus calyciflorus]